MRTMFFTNRLCLAALTLDDPSARTALAAQGAGVEDVRSAIAKVHAAVLGALGIDAGDDGLPDRPGPSRPAVGPYRSTGSLQDTFQEARRLSAADRPSALRTGHIAIAAAGREHGTVARVLDLLGIDRARLPKRRAPRLPREAGRPGRRPATRRALRRPASRPAKSARGCAGDSAQRSLPA